MNSWDLKALNLKPRLPEILSSSEAARAIVLDLAAGESLADHQVHERAWPGHGHPGAMTIREKLYARRHAAKQAT